MKDIDGILQKYTAQDGGTLSGVSFIVVDKTGSRLYARSWGSSKLHSSEYTALQLDDVNFIASMTKLMTSVAVMQCVERGLVGLDDDVSKIVPRLTGRGIAIEVGDGVEVKKSSTRLTLRLLLTHSSGFSYDLADPALLKWSASQGRTANCLSGTLEAFDHPLSFEPGTSWVYGVGLDWAGQVVEALTKRSLENYMKENIWSELGMNDTTFHPEMRPELQARQVEMANRDADGKLVHGSIPLAMPARTDMGGVGAYSTPNDYAKLLVGLLSDDAPLLNQKSLDIMTSGHLGDASRESMMNLMRHSPMRELGLGGLWTDHTDGDHSLCGPVSLADTPGQRAKGTVGWSGLPNLFWWMDRENGIAATLFTQILPSGDKPTTQLMRDLETAVYANVVK